VEVVLDAGGSGGNPSASGYGKPPAVIAYNHVGKKRVVEEVDTDQRAEERMSVIENDFRTLPIAEWCERYCVDSSFVSG
jgi:hypothetical protein